MLVLQHACFCGLLRIFSCRALARAVLIRMFISSHTRVSCNQLRKKAPVVLRTGTPYLLKNEKLTSSSQASKWQRGGFRNRLPKPFTTRTACRIVSKTIRVSDIFFFPTAVLLRYFRGSSAGQLREWSVFKVTLPYRTRTLGKRR